MKVMMPEGGRHAIAAVADAAEAIAAAVDDWSGTKTAAMESDTAAVKTAATVEAATMTAATAATTTTTPANLGRLAVMD